MFLRRSVMPSVWHVGGDPPVLRIHSTFANLSPVGIGESKPRGEVGWGDYFRYNNFMTKRVSVAAILLAIMMTDCATSTGHSGSHPKAASQAEARTVETSTRSPWIRISLPYTYSRHGVEIQVTSVEFSNTTINVNITLQETRNQNVYLTVSTLMQAVTSGGVTLQNAGYTQAGKTQTDPALHIVARDHSSASLLFTIPPLNTAPINNSFELRFPTGKYWSSQT